MDISKCVIIIIMYMCGASSWTLPPLFRDLVCHVWNCWIFKLLWINEYKGKLLWKKCNAVKMWMLADCLVLWFVEEGFSVGFSCVCFALSLFLRERRCECVNSCGHQALHLVQTAVDEMNWWVYAAGLPCFVDTLKNISELNQVLSLFFLYRIISKKL